MRPWTRTELLRALLSALICSALLALVFCMSTVWFMAACVGLAAGPLVLLGCWLDDQRPLAGWVQLLAALFANLASILLAVVLAVQSVHLSVLLEGQGVAQPSGWAQALLDGFDPQGLALLAATLAVPACTMALAEAFNRRRLDALPAIGATWVACFCALLPSALFTRSSSAAEQLVVAFPPLWTLLALVSSLVLRPAYWVADLLVGETPLEEVARHQAEPRQGSAGDESPGRP